LGYRAAMIAILTDIHGNLPALLAVVADAQARGVRRFVNLGDTLSGPLWPAETADWLMARDWPTIAGNHERQLLTLPDDRVGPSDAYARVQLGQRHLAWLAAQGQRLAIDGALMVHGSPASDVEHLMFDIERGRLAPAAEAVLAARLGGETARMVVCGHTHLPRVVRLAGGAVVANPGSVGLQAYDDDHPAVYRVEVGDADARYAILNEGQIELVRVAYDSGVAAARAADNGRADWAVALATGRMG
jgi:predicted phosphodiesterase